MATPIAAPSAAAQTAPPIAHVGFSPAAAQAIDSLAAASRTERVEHAACVTGYAVRGDTMFVIALSAAIYANADSVAIFVWSSREMCPRGVPTLHTHVASNGLIYQPSTQDLETARRLGVWALIIAIVPDGGWRLILYP